jgi:hypothetical protein
MRPLTLRLPTMTIMLAAAALGVAAPAVAQTMQSASVTMVRTGWNADSFAVVTAEPVVNPARCPTADGYISDKSLPGYQTLYTAALTAIAARHHVVVTVHNTECFGGRPKLIGINLLSD